MNNENVVAACIEHVTKYDHVTFVELVRIMEGSGIDTEGDQAIHLDGRPNTILWAGLNQDAIDLLREVFTRTDQTGASYLAYMVDGGMLTLPLAKKPNQAKDYTKEHWLPICFRPKGSVK